MADPFLRAVELPPDRGGPPRTGYPWTLPAIAPLGAGLALHPSVTYLIGENGSGKSTLLEAIAVAAGMNPEGGSSSFAFATRKSHSELSSAIRLVRGGRRPRTDFFLRAESLFNAATYLERLNEIDVGTRRRPARRLRRPLAPRAVARRVVPGGDDQPVRRRRPVSARRARGRAIDPELPHRACAASTSSCSDGSQLIIATHSPIILAYPESTIYHCGEHGLEAIEYEDADPVRLTRSFLEARDRFLAELLRD